METIILVVNALVIGFALGMAFSDWKTERILFGPFEDDDPK